MRAVPEWVSSDAQGRQWLPYLIGLASPQARAAASINLAQLLTSADQPDEALRLLDEADSELARAGLPRTLFRGRARSAASPMSEWMAVGSQLCRAAALLFVDRPEDAAATMGDVIGTDISDDLFSIGIPVVNATVQMGLGRPALAEGILGPVLDGFGDATELSDAHAHWHRETRLRMAQARIRLGRPEGQSEAIEQLSNERRLAGFRVSSWASDRVLAHIAEGRFHELADLADRLDADASGFSGPRNHRVDEMWARVALVDAVLAEDSAQGLDRVLGTPRRSRAECLAVASSWVSSLSDRASTLRGSAPDLPRRLRGMEALLPVLADAEALDRLTSFGESLAREVADSEPSHTGVLSLARRDAVAGDVATARARCSLATAMAGDDSVRRALSVHSSAVVHRLAGEPLMAYEELADLPSIPERWADELIHELAAAAGAAGLLDAARSGYETAAARHREHGHHADTLDCQRNLRHLRGDLDPGFEPFQSGLFEMLWG